MKKSIEKPIYLDHVVQTMARYFENQSLNDNQVKEFLDSMGVDDLDRKTVKTAYDRYRDRRDRAF